MKNSQKTLVVWMILLVATLLLFQTTHTPPQGQKLPFNKFIEHVKAGHVEKVTFRSHGRIAGKFKKEVEGGSDFDTIGDTNSEYYVRLVNEHGLIPNYEIEEGRSLWLQFLISWGPMVIFVVLLMVFLRQLQVNGGKAMSFGRSRAKLLTDGHTRVTFDDVAGCEEAKEELEEIVEFLRDPKKFTRLGGKIPKGVLLVGSPGTGKTLLAKAVAGEAVVPFFSISGSDFVEMFVGVGASRVRDLFEQGKKHAPCIIFIDEIDAVGRQRGAGLGGGHDEREQTLNQLLVEMDGFDSREGVIMIAATNRPDVLDPALLRPGRFDRTVTVGRPDARGRKGILEVHTKRMPLGADVNLEILARGTPGFSGADLQNLANEAALLAARENLTEVGMRSFEKAKDKVLMGAERRSMVIGEEERRMVAYHEAGHTIVGKSIEGLDPIHKVTIIPRGMALGVTMTLPNEDRLTLSKDKAESLIAFMMGGCVAETLIYGEKTNGAADDIDKATNLAKKMVCEWGMSDKIGPMAIGRKDESVFLGREIHQAKDISQKTAETVDGEIRKVLTENHDRAKKILKDNLDVLHAMADALVERESLSAEEVELLMQGKKLPPLEVSPSDSGKTSLKGKAKKAVGAFKTEPEVA